MKNLDNIMDVSTNAIDVYYELVSLGFDRFRGSGDGFLENTMLYNTYNLQL